MMQLFVRSGSRYRLAKGIEIQEAASHVDARQFEANRTLIADPSDAKGFFVNQLSHCLVEYFCVLFLDAQRRVISFDRAFRGTIDTATVHPREILRAVLDCNAHSVIFAHNHPSGECQPSSADCQLTQHLISALGLFDIQVLDHIIVGGTETFSFSEVGLL